jgi:hypothetical protein
LGLQQVAALEVMARFAALMCSDGTAGTEHVSSSGSGSRYSTSREVAAVVVDALHIFGKAFGADVR